jgi:thiol-disulfide isomerase/thioredoxin
MVVIKRIISWCIVFLFFSVGNAYATCELTSSTQYLLPNESTSFDITFKNLNSNSISAILLPINFSSEIGITSHSIQEPGWEVVENPDYFIYTGNLNYNESVTFNFSANTGNESIAIWTLNASENPNGEPSETCGTININISSQVPNNSPSITNTHLSVTNNNATLSWTTNTSTSGLVNYGTSSNYGTTASSPEGTTHSAVLSNLSPSTTYHYQISASNENETVNTVDDTFTTSAADVSITTTTTVTNTVTNTVQNTITKILSDTTPPTVSITSDFSKTLKESGEITGNATDTGLVNAGISSLEYSVDSGKNWLPITDVATPNTKKTDFSFFPNLKDDGNYIIKVRVKDLSGNTGISKPYTLIIDRLPPAVGGNLFLLGPLVLHPNYEGKVFTIENLPINLTLSAVGGPLSINLFSGTEKFALKKNTESGLWFGTIQLKEVGNYTLKAKSIDGGKNETEKEINTIVVLPAGKVSDTQGKIIQKAKVSVYTLEKTTNHYVLWESEPYSQINPQLTDDLGSYRFVLPPGKFYLQIEASDKIKLRTEIFELASVTPINQSFQMEMSSFWTKWWPKIAKTTISSATESEPESTNLLTNKPIIDFDLSTPEINFSNLSILGKPTLISFFASWDPTSSDQIKELDLLKKENEGLGVYAVDLQESNSKAKIFKKIGGFNFDIIADPDGFFVLPLSIKALPTHLFIDKKGIIKSVLDGYLSKNNLLQEILK